MRIHYIREFLVLTETLNYTEAAKRLHITQPALSKHVDAMEKILGVRLLARSSAGVRLTAEGEGFRKDAVRIVSEYDYALEKIEARKRRSSTVVRIGYLRDAARRVLLPLHAWFKKYHPDVELRFLSVEYMRLSEDLRTRQADVIITMDDDPSLRAECETVPLYDDTFVAAVAPWHRLAQRDSVKLADLEGERLLVPSRHVWPNIRSFFDSRCSADLLANSRRMSDVDTLFFLIESGQGVAVVTSHNRYVYGGKVKFLPLDEPDVPTFPVSALWLKESNGFEGTARAIELMRRACERIRRDLAD
ncbi:MAG TPA: LysR family transcriptional regulator [Candidatus Aphodovivens avistercoris]|nr:LysR family transcriptional regulator [Candidatus Aphodovivens avistercoris]